jgi:hypothetical protein
MTKIYSFFSNYHAKRYGAEIKRNGYTYEAEYHNNERIYWSNMMLKSQGYEVL